jgi:Mn-containing catalase
LLPLAVRLYNATTDAGMKDMLTYLIARDTMHQNQWPAAIEDMGGAANLPIPNSFPQTAEN